MVSCAECGEKLPWGCTCRISDRKKIINFFDQGLKEFELCRDILKGKKPTVTVDGRTYEPSWKIVRSPNGVFVEITFQFEGRFKEVCLMDAELRPLYRKTIGQLGCFLGRKDTSKVTWKIGGETL